jgi:hypothetical protein
LIAYKVKKAGRSYHPVAGRTTRFVNRDLDLGFRDSPAGEVGQHSSNLVAAHYFDRTVIITVTLVGMMQVVIDEIVYMIAMRYCLVAATGSMLMIGLVTAAIMIGRATLRIFCTDIEDMFLDEF